MPGDSEITSIETGNVEFDNSFSVFADNSIDAHSILNPLVIEKLIECRKQFGEFALCFNNEKLYASFQYCNAFIPFPKEVKQLNEATEKAVVEGARKMLRAIDELCYALSPGTKETFLQENSESLFKI